jgi:hypothetical protein
VCENLNYVMHMTEESQQIRLEKHMLSMSKPDSPVLPGKTNKTGTSGL